MVNISDYKFQYFQFLYKNRTFSFRVKGRHPNEKTFFTNLLLNFSNKLCSTRGFKGATAISAQSKEEDIASKSRGGVILS